MGSVGRTQFSDLLLRACPGLETCYRTGARKALLAAVASGELDIAVYPGVSEPGADVIPLCEDRLVVAMRADHALAQAASICLAQLWDAPVLLPIEGGEGDFRRLTQALLREPLQLREIAMTDLLQRLAASDALALVAAGQHDEMGSRIVTRPVEGVDTAFAVQLTWSARIATTFLGELLALAAKPDGTTSPPLAPCAMSDRGRRRDDPGADGGDVVLG